MIKTLFQRAIINKQIFLSSIVKRFSEIKIDSFYDKKSGQLISIEDVLKSFLPKKIYANVRTMLQGKETLPLKFDSNIINVAKKNKFQIAGYKFTAEKEQLTSPRIIRIGAIQNKIVEPTTKPIIDQKKSLRKRIALMIETAFLSGVNIVCMQEAWTAPFFYCTREKMPWLEFAESATKNGDSTKHMCELAEKQKMAIVHPILERDDLRGTIHNAAVIINKHGKVIGKHHKNHIPRVGDFNESTYYMEGQTGHPVFDVEFAKIAVNICYGRHHPLNWLGFGLNGAEIVFNPSATVGALSEPLWPIEARNAAVANHYFTVGINRVGTEHQPNPFTSGDGKPAHKDFGHFYGSSQVAGPDGSRTPGLSRTQDGLLVAELDLNLCRQLKDKWGFTMTARMEMYAKLLNEYIKSNYKPQIIS